MLIEHKFIGVDKSQAFIHYMEAKLSKLSTLIDVMNVDIYEEANMFVVALSTKHMGREIRVEKQGESVYKAFDLSLEGVKGIVRKHKSEVDKLRRERSEHKHYMEEIEIDEEEKY